MHTRHCVKIVNRMSPLLEREIGCGVDAQRMIADTAYARDVLLVCDAMPGSELASLAQHFRRAAAAPEEQDTRRRSGLSASKFLGSIFGPSSGFDSGHEHPAPHRPPAPQQHSRWFSRGRSAPK